MMQRESEPMERKDLFYKYCENEMYITRNTFATTILQKTRGIYVETVRGINCVNVGSANAFTFCAALLQQWFSNVVLSVS